MYVCIHYVCMYVCVYVCMYVELLPLTHLLEIIAVCPWRA